MIVFIGVLFGAGFAIGVAAVVEIAEFVRTKIKERKNVILNFVAELQVGYEYGLKFYSVNELDKVLIMDPCHDEFEITFGNNESFNQVKTELEDLFEEGEW